MARERAVSRLLRAGAIANVLFALFHVGQGLEIARGTALPPDARGLLLALNVAATLLLALFAYAFLLRGADLLGTGLGRAVLVVAALFYWSRAAEELLWFRFSSAMFLACVLAGAIPAALFVVVARHARHERP
jgi:predicted membrane channel-forming protein YqfA (hemolysin III family)